MNWHRPSEKPEPNREGVVMREDEDINLGVPYMQVCYTLNGMPPSVIGWIYTSDLCADFEASRKEWSE